MGGNYTTLVRTITWYPPCSFPVFPNPLEVSSFRTLYFFVFFLLSLPIPLARACIGDLLEWVHWHVFWGTFLQEFVTQWLVRQVNLHPFSFFYFTYCHRHWLLRLYPIDFFMIVQIGKRKCKDVEKASINVSCISKTNKFTIFWQ